MWKKILEYFKQLFAPEKDIEQLEQIIGALRDEVVSYKEKGVAIVPRNSAIFTSSDCESDILRTLPQDDAAARSVLESEVVRLRVEMTKLMVEKEHSRERVKKLGAALFEAAVFE